MCQGMSIAATQDEDEDSLFGSPPPSPGRPASPALALPGTGYRGGSIAANLTQNVGTIALPGSHPDSELPINPLALSLNHGIVQRPPALQSVDAYAARTYGPGPSHSRRSSSSYMPKKKTKLPRQESPSKPAEPEFELPDPSAPPPAHFLRNQQNLLGKAGMIAGVKPSALAHARGSTPSNPIIVDEDDDRPTIGRRAQSREKTHPYIDPSLLSAPTNQEIVSVLIGQKDIFPILEGVLKLIMGNTPALPKAPTGFEPRSAHRSQPPAKKRRLSRVPAGATDWDVPYPFQQGEGPEAYHQTWERERGKQLISQLIKLIKSAARKAATKKYLQDQKEKEMKAAGEQHRLCMLEAKNNVHRRLEATCFNDVLQDTSNTSPVVQSDSAQATPSVEMDPSIAAFDQFMLSIDNLPQQSHHDVQPPCGTIDQPLFDTWMSLLETFPVNVDGTSTQTSTQCSTPAPEMSDFDFVNMFGVGMASSDPSAPTVDFDAMMTSLFPDQSLTDAAVPFTIPPEDHLIDPALLALDLQKYETPIPPSITTSTPSEASGSTESAVLSPTVSGSSVGDSTTPGTPSSAGWDLSLPGIYGNGGAILGGDEGISEAWPASGTSVEGSMVDLEVLHKTSQQTNKVINCPAPSVSAKAKGKERMVDPPPAQAATVPATTLPVSLTQSSACTPSATLIGVGSLALPQQMPYGSVVGMVSVAPSHQKTEARKQRNEDIVRRAQERRKALQEELDSMKIRLWGSTIEQAGLILLSQKLNGGNNPPVAGATAPQQNAP